MFCRPVILYCITEAIQVIEGRTDIPHEPRTGAACRPVLSHDRTTNILDVIIVAVFLQAYSFIYESSLTSPFI
jgi:hypothetical protein